MTPSRKGTRSVDFIVRKIINGIPHYVYPDGTRLPVMAGGQDPWEHLLGGTTSEPPKLPTGEINVNDLVGRQFYEPNANAIGVFRTRIDRKTGRRVYWLSDPQTGRAIQVPSAGTLIDLVTRQAYNLLSRGVATSGGEVSQADLARFLGIETAGGGAAPAFSGTQAGIELDARLQAEENRRQEAFRAEQDRLEREARIEQQRLEREAQAKMSRLSRLTELITQFSERFGKDPFREGAALGGQVTRGVTPAEASLARMGGAIQTLQNPALGSQQALEQTETALLPQPLGFARGTALEGEIIPPGQAVRVGEAGEEIVENLPGDRLRVIPLAASAQFGLPTTLPNFATDPRFATREAALQALEPAFASLGLPPSTFARAPITGGVAADLGFLSQLGVSPQLVRDPTTGSTFFRDPATGSYRGMTSPDVFNQSGFRWQDVVDLSPADIASLRLGPLLTAPIPPGSVTPRPQAAFGALPGVLSVPVPGGSEAFIPAPFRIAAELQRLARVNPVAFENLLSAWQLGSFSPQSVQAQVVGATPTGPSRGLLGIR